MQPDKCRRFEWIERKKESFRGGFISVSIKKHHHKQTTTEDSNGVVEDTNRMNLVTEQLM